MRRYTTNTQNVLAFGLPFEGSLDPKNRWVLLADALPWDDLVKPYLDTLCENNGRPSVDARRVVAALLIKHLKGLSDDNTIEEVKENPYLQYFAGLPAFQQHKLFEPSLFVTLRKRLGDTKFDEMNDVIIRHFTVKTTPKDDIPKDDIPKDDIPKDDIPKDDIPKDDIPKDTKIATIMHKGHLKIDTTAAPQNITFPTDFKLLNKCRQHTEHLIDCLYFELKLTLKPRTYRKEARAAYLKIARIKSKSKKQIRKGLKEQLAYIRRNIKTINTLWDTLAAKNEKNGTFATPESWKLIDLRNWWVLQEVYSQQRFMYDNNVTRIDHRIVSISQPYVRPIVRGKEHKKTEFGAKIGLSTCNGYSRLDHIDWTNYGDAADLPLQVERYKKLYGYYPESVNADKIYHTKANHAYLKDKEIRFIGKPLGRPTTVSKTAAAQRTLRKEQAQRNLIEGKIGQMKTTYGLDLILAKTSRTTFAWIAASVLVTNLVTALKALRLWLKTEIAYLLKLLALITYNPKWKPQNSTF